MSVSVTEELSIEATPDAVWAVISDPAMHERLDPRCRLESRSGEDGQPGSEYVLVVPASAFAKSRLRYVIVSADAGRSLVAEVSRGARTLGEQRAEILTSGDGALLRWTVVLRGGRLTRGLAAALSKRQLRTWLAAVEREALLR